MTIRYVDGWTGCEYPANTHWLPIFSELFSCTAAAEDGENYLTVQDGENLYLFFLGEQVNPRAIEFDRAEFPRRVEFPSTIPPGVEENLYREFQARVAGAVQFDDEAKNRYSSADRLESMFEILLATGKTYSQCAVLASRCIARAQLKRHALVRLASCVLSAVETYPSWASSIDEKISPIVATLQKSEDMISTMERDVGPLKDTLEQLRKAVQAVRASLPDEDVLKRVSAASTKIQEYLSPDDPTPKFRVLQNGLLNNFSDLMAEIDQCIEKMRVLNEEITSGQVMQDILNEAQNFAVETSGCDLFTTRILANWKQFSAQTSKIALLLLKLKFPRIEFLSLWEKLGFAESDFPSEMDCLRRAYVECQKIHETESKNLDKSESESKALLFCVKDFKRRHLNRQKLETVMYMLNRAIVAIEESDEDNSQIVEYSDFSEETWTSLSMVSDIFRENSLFKLALHDPVPKLRFSLQGETAEPPLSLESGVVYVGSSSYEIDLVSRRPIKIIDSFEPPSCGGVESRLHSVAAAAAEELRTFSEEEKQSLSWLLRQKLLELDDTAAADVVHKEGEENPIAAAAAAVSTSTSDNHLPHPSSLVDGSVQTLQQPMISRSTSASHESEEEIQSLRKEIEFKSRQVTALEEYFRSSDTDVNKESRELNEINEELLAIRLLLRGSELSRLDEKRQQTLRIRFNEKTKLQTRIRIIKEKLEALRQYLQQASPNSSFVSVASASFTSK